MTVKQKSQTLRKGKRSGVLTFTVAVPVTAKVPPEFERYVVLKTASDLLAIEAEGIFRKVMGHSTRANRAKEGGK